jgi:hypothetical protein
MMNLSHPNLTAMIKRVFREKMPVWLIRFFDRLGTFSLILKLFVWLLLLVPILLVLLLLAVIIPFVLLLLIIPSAKNSLTGTLKEKVTDVMNLLAVMETDIGDCLIQMEEELRGKYDAMGGLTLIGDGGHQRVYDKIVMTPLIMDFGLKNYQNSKSSYKVRWKPVVAQVEDLFLGIRDYYRHREDYIKSQGSPVPAFFEIHPFMGINTRNYRLRSHPRTDGTQSILEDLLDKNFGEFDANETPEIRYGKIAARDWTQFNGNIESIGSYDFVGIKVYPPLGFNPWPEQQEYATANEWRQEMEKVCCLYDFCIGHNIPLTAHCSPGGFLVDPAYRAYASPDKWAKVLGEKDKEFVAVFGQKDFSRLRLDLAHFGGAECDEWRNKVVDLIMKYDNVYTDISYQGVDQKIYEKMKRFLDSLSAIDRARLMERIIFGTDFMINLQDIERYSQYLDYFAQAKGFTLTEKDWLCNRNAMCYLYLA